jgi:hypothetical protein
MKQFRINKTRLFLRCILFTSLILGSGLSLLAQDLKVVATVDTNKLLIGDQTYLRLTIENKPGYTIEWPVISDTALKGIEIVKRFLPDTVSRLKDIFRVQMKFLITSFDSGQHDVPQFTLVANSGNLHDTLSSNPVSLWVNTVPVDTAKTIFDIKKPYGAPLTLSEVLPYVGIGLGILLLIILIVYIIKRLKEQKPLIPARISIEPPHITALRNLDQLKDEKLWQQGQVKLYYTRLTDIIRLYIEGRFAVQAMEQTSDEILASLKKMSIDDESCFSALKELLSLADLVKFAKALPLPDENESNILNAYLFVNHTKMADVVGSSVIDSETSKSNEQKEVSHG